MCACLLSCSLMSHSVTLGLQHTRLPCPPLSPIVHSNSYPLSHWCYLTISPSATLFSFCLQFFPAYGSFSMSQFFTWGGQSIGASASVLPMNIQGWLPLGLTGLISLQSKELSRVIGLWAVSLGITESFQTRGRGSPVSGDSQALSWAKGNRTWSRKYVSLMALACRADVKMNKQGGMIILFWIYVHISYRRS